MKENVYALERKQLGLTQEQLARKLNTSRSNVANWENGQNNPSIELMIKCAEIFDCDVLYLAGYQNERIIKDDDVPMPDYDGYYIDIQKPVSQREILFNKSKNLISESDWEIIEFILNKTIKNYEKNKKKEKHTP